MKNGSQATIGKITQEIINLQCTEMGEVEEPFNVEKIGSGTMPHKSDTLANTIHINPEVNGRLFGGHNHKQPFARC